MHGCVWGCADVEYVVLEDDDYRRVCRLTLKVETDVNAEEDSAAVVKDAPQTNGDELSTEAIRCEKAEEGTVRQQVKSEATECAESRYQIQYHPRSVLAEFLVPEDAFAASLAVSWRAKAIKASERVFSHEMMLIRLGADVLLGRRKVLQRACH